MVKYKSVLAQSLDELETRANWLERDGEDVSAWLEAYEKA
jgi:hypothetical protein